MKQCVICWFFAVVIIATGCIAVALVDPLDPRAGGLIVIALITYLAGGVALWKLPRI